MIVSELIGEEFDLAIAKANREELVENPFGLVDRGWWISLPNKQQMKVGREYSPSTNWAQGGIIIEAENITIINNSPDTAWIASIQGPEFTECRILEYGPTPLIAAMRCFVSLKLNYTS